MYVRAYELFLEDFCKLLVLFTFNQKRIRKNTLHSSICFYARRYIEKSTINFHFSLKQIQYCREGKANN